MEDMDNTYSMMTSTSLDEKELLEYLYIIWKLLKCIS